MAIEGHARMLEQYTDLEERHIHLHEGIVDVKKATSKARVRGVESKFINALGTEIFELKAEREKKRHL